MMTAIQTGLRAVDIANLKRQDIDWRAKEIRIIQHKTGRPLSLLLPTETGNAIADYLLNGRPECDLPYIFLCGDKPYRQLKNRSASSIVSRYMRRIGITESAIPRRGFHSFRRTFGTQLLESGIPLDMLSELLGHSHIDSSKPYLSVNEAGLKSCALGLVPLEKAGELL
jgi:integrase